MPDTVLKLVQDFTSMRGLPVPGTLSGNDPQIRQILGCLQAYADTIIEKYDWQALRRRVTFTVPLAQESQGSIYNLCGPDFVRITNETIWDMTNRRPVFGPQAEPDYQAAIALNESGTLYRYRIEEVLLKIWPIPAVGVDLSWFWVSSNWVRDVDGVYKSQITRDTDTLIFSDRMTRIALHAFWLRAKNLPFELEMAEFVTMAVQSAATTSPARRYALDSEGAHNDVKPGIYIPTGAYIAP